MAQEREAQGAASKFVNAKICVLLKKILLFD
jgi:hypothetical protein